MLFSEKRYLLVIIFVINSLAMISVHLPFIASKVGGIVDMVGDELSIRDNIYTYDNAVLIDGFNADDFVSGIKYFKDLAKRKLTNMLFLVEEKQ